MIYVGSMNAKGRKLYAPQLAASNRPTLELGKFDSWEKYQAHINHIFKLKSRVKRITDEMAAVINSKNAKRLMAFLATKETLNLTPPVALTEIGYDVAGSYVDVSRYLGGEPECMVCFDATENTTRFVDVRIRTTGAGRSCQRYHVMTLSLIDWMEANGIRCRVYWQIDHYCLDGVDGQVNRVRAAIQLKDYHEAIDLVKLTNFLMGDSSSDYCVTLAQCIMKEENSPIGIDSKYFLMRSLPDQTYNPLDVVPTITIPSVWFGGWLNREEHLGKTNEFGGPLDPKATVQEFLRQIGLSELVNI